MTFSAVFKYSFIAATTVLVAAGIAFAVELVTDQRQEQRRQETGQLARQTMLRVWHYPPTEPDADDINKLLVLCAYASPYTRDQINSPAATYRFLRIWQEAIQRQGPEPVTALLEQCRVNPQLVDPTPPQILWRSEIIKRGQEAD